jgi:hypothetical protein
MYRRHSFRLVLLFASATAGAQEAAPPPGPGDQFSFMQLLDAYGLHDRDDESWNAYGRFTHILSGTPSFPSPYTNPNGSINSLLPTSEHSFTGTLTLYAGVDTAHGQALLEYLRIPTLSSTPRPAALRVPVTFATDPVI